MAPSVSSYPTIGGSSLNEVIACIAVIDESAPGPGIVTRATMEGNWTEFRTRFPNRPFCLLQPKRFQSHNLLIPAAFDGIHVRVDRDHGDPALAVDWFQICDLEGMRQQGIGAVSLFLDETDSLSNDVVESMKLFLKRVSGAGMKMRDPIINTHEDWISPFLTDFGLIPSSAPSDAPSAAPTAA
ncbi:Chromosome [Seminavis robusta]|uniref:Chromosome n=1 Tax=Seminavis robusta TaxID=568900 RepID=A0A9N8DJW4_9STRA|nr:Chromosome [Seminavis robusta]|eukprot:Sro123_g059700.1 Chromosome (184) ;mRNA; r:90758-91309